MKTSYANETLLTKSEKTQTRNYSNNQIEQWKSIQMSYRSRIDFLLRLARWIEASGSYSNWFQDQVEEFDRMKQIKVDPKAYKLSGRPEGEEFIRAFYELCRQGVPFSESVDFFPGVFSRRAMGILKIAHESRGFEKALRREAELLHKELKAKSQFIGAIIYPAVIIVTAIVFMFIVMTYVLPGFTLLYEGLLGNTEMHWTMQVMVRISNFLTTYWPILATAFVATIIGYPGLRRTVPQVIELEDELLLKIPVISTWILQMETSNFILSLCAVLEVIPGHTTAIQLASSVFANRTLRKKCELAAASLNVSHFTIHDALAAYIPYYEASSTFYKAMRSIYDTGSTKELENYAVILEEEADATQERILQLIPHVLLILVGIVVGFAVFAVYIPLLELVGKMAAK